MKKNRKLAKLVHRVRRGDMEAWSELYEQTYREAYLVAIKVTGKKEDAEDLVHDGFVTAFEKLDSLSKVETFQSWLNMIVANKCRDYLRKEKPELFMDMTPEEEEPDWADDREDWQPEQKLDRDETNRIVAGIIEELPEDQKLCVILYYREELSVSQISEALEVSEGTVKSRLNYARKKVKTKVEALAKQGVVLYSIAPAAVLMGALKWELLHAQIPASAAPAVTAGAAGSAAAAGTAGVGVSGAAAGIAAKVIAGFTVLSVVTGGVMLYTSAVQEEIVPTSVPTVITEATLPPTVSPTIPTEPMPTETSAPEETDILAETLGFTKGWVISHDVNGSKFLTFFAFDPDKVFYMTCGYWMSELSDGCVNTYTISGNEVCFLFERRNGCSAVTYLFEPETLQLTQLSEEGLLWGQTPGTVLQLDDEMEIERDKIVYFANYYD